jgi:chromosome segregation ATPase
MDRVSDKSRYKEIIDKKNSERDEMALKFATLERKMRFHEQKERDSNMIRTNDEANELRQLRDAVVELEAELLDKKTSLQATSLELSDTRLELNTTQSRVDSQGRKIDELLKTEDNLSQQVTTM